MKEIFGVWGKTKQIVIIAITAAIYAGTLIPVQAHTDRAGPDRIAACQRDPGFIRDYVRPCRGMGRGDRQPDCGFFRHAVARERVRIFREFPFFLYSFFNLESNGKG